MTVLLYLAIGAAFALAAIVSFDRGGQVLLAVTTLLTTVGLFLGSLSEVWAASQADTAFGFPVLLAIVPPFVTASVIHWLGSIKASKRVQWVVGMLVWIVTLAPIGLIASIVN